jgi:hypothetical protein
VHFVALQQIASRNAVKHGRIDLVLQGQPISAPRCFQASIAPWSHTKSGLHEAFYRLFSKSYRVNKRFNLLVTTDAFGCFIDRAI